MLRFTAALLLLTAPMCAQEFRGWGKANWGATPAEIELAYHGEIQKADDGSLTLLYSIGSDAFTASFIFAVDGLSAVELAPVIGDYTLQSKPPFDLKAFETKARITETALRLASLLEEKYGPPAKQWRAPGSGSLELIRIWNMDGGNIDLQLRYVGPVYKLRLRYERKSKALDKI